jgi:hypothetical protein
MRRLRSCTSIPNTPSYTVHGQLYPYSCRDRLTVPATKPFVSLRRFGFTVSTAGCQDCADVPNDVPKCSSSNRSCGESKSAVRSSVFCCGLRRGEDGGLLILQPVHFVTNINMLHVSVRTAFLRESSRSEQYKPNTMTRNASPSME